MSAALERLGDGLEELARAGLRRHRRTIDSPQGAHVVLAGRTLVNFSSNDYLGLANHPTLKAAAHAAVDEYGTGAGASPLVSGHQRPHDELEARFAGFVGMPRALLFGSGYAANLGVVTAICERGAEVFADRLNHACLNDGMLLSRAHFHRYRHLDVPDLEARLGASRSPVKLVATDAVFSMDGDIAPLPGILEACERHDAWLLVDDAHGIGTLGARGRGVLEHFDLRSPRLIYMATLGKALGGYGAVVAAAPGVIEWLVNRARTYVFSTALPPACAAVASAALELLEADTTPVKTLRERIVQLRGAAQAVGLQFVPSASPIQPIIVGDAPRAVAASASLLEQGYFVPAIRPPTVPDGTSRLRISVSAAHGRDDVVGLAAALVRGLRP